MQTREIKFNSNAVTLAGTLAAPQSTASPIAILIPGSGQVDRDENHKRIKINFFKEIADYFEQFGIATLRYDKRGVGKSGGDFWTTGFFDNISDAGAAIDFAKQQPEVDPKQIYLIGHSEGAMIATRLAAERNDLTGAILVSGTARVAELVLREQAEKVVQGLSRWYKLMFRILHFNPIKSQQKMIEKVKGSPKDVILYKLLVKLNAKWMREVLAYNPAIDLCKINIPLMAITGGKDIQTPPEDVALMAELVRGPIETHVITDLTHIMRRDPEPPSVMHYKRLVKQPVDREVLDLMAKWISQTRQVEKT